MDLNQKIYKLKNTLEKIIKENNSIHFILVNEIKAWNIFKYILDIIIDNVKNNLTKITKEAISVLVLTKIQNTHLYSEFNSQNYLIIIQTEINIILNKALGISKILTARIQALDHIQKNLIEVQDKINNSLNESIYLIGNIKTMNVNDCNNLINKILDNVKNNQSKLKYLFQKTINNSWEKIYNIRNKILNDNTKNNATITINKDNCQYISYLNDVIKEINNIWNLAMVNIIKAKTDTINKIANDRSKRQTNNSVALNCHHHQNKKRKIKN